MIPILHKIQAAISAEFDVTLDELSSQSRKARISEARHAATLLFCECFIGRETHRAGLLGRGRAAVTNSIERANALISTDPDYKARFERAKERVK